MLLDYFIAFDYFSRHLWSDFVSSGVIKSFEDCRFSLQSKILGDSDFDRIATLTPEQRGVDVRAENCPVYNYYLLMLFHLISVGQVVFRI